METWREQPFENMREIRVRLIVWVLFVNSIVCLFVFYACFLFLSVFGWDCWLAWFGWLVFLGFNVFVFVRRV